MSNISNVSQVIGVATKKDGSELRGQGKKGPWVMYSVILENGTKLNVFGPVKEGDLVYDLEQDPQYHSWKGKVKQAGDSTYPNKASSAPDMSQPTTAQVLEAARKLYARMEERFEVIENMIAGLEVTPQTKQALSQPEPQQDKREAGTGANRDYAPTYDEVNEDIENGKPIDLSDIPF